MRVCVHRGSKEIGGTCVEIESRGQRIVLDIGLPLDSSDADAIPLYPVPGFDHADPSLLGVVISHPHQDHYGLAYRLPPETKFLIGRAAKDILSAAGAFTPTAFEPRNVIHLEDRRPIVLGPFTITPFLVDHSAYDSYAVMVEADGKRLFYTGDFRVHGRKAKLVERLIDKPPAGVDVLLMEGTNVGRSEVGGRFPTEDELIPGLVDLFENTNGLALVWASGQNLDRLVTLYKSSVRAGRQFILDLYTAHVLRAAGNDRLPQAHWDNIKIFLPQSQKLRIVRDQSFELARPFRPYRVFEEQLPALAERSVMLFRPSMIRDLKRIEGLKIGRLVCSIWKGYLSDPSNQPLLQWLKERQIPLDCCHTSGHAHASDLARLRRALPGARVLPVHTAERVQFVDTIDGPFLLAADGDWFDVL